MTDIVERLRKMAICVYLATEKGPADDLSAGLREAADEIERLQAALHRLQGCDIANDAQNIIRYALEEK